MKLSFVIPAYNEEKSLPSCLESVFREIGRNNDAEFEVIVVNNASADRTGEVARKCGAIVVDEPKKGLTRARQAGFENSTGDLIANVDADTVLPEGWIEKVIEQFSGNHELVCLSGPHVFHDAPALARILTRTFYVFGMAFYVVNKHVLKTGSMVQGGNFIVRRSALEKIGGFNTSIDFYGEDTDIAKRLNDLGNVKFSLSLPIYASARRIKAEGMVKTGARYAANFLWMSYFKKPLTKTHADFRQNYENTERKN